MALIRVVTYFHECDACGRKVSSTGTDPDTGVVGSLHFPDSSHGQRQTFSFYSCKEQAAHIAKAMRIATAQREEDIRGRKARGEAYSSTTRSASITPSGDTES